MNNLDLIVKTPDGQTRYGNGGTSPNTNDNVETIRLENPAVGRYAVTVTATRVNPILGSQPYALVATTKQRFETNVSNVDLEGETVQPTPTPITQTLGSLSGFVFGDLNANGEREVNEGGVAGARVLVTSVNGGPTTQTTTNNAGAYAVQDLPIGTYKVQIALPGFTFTTASSTQIAVGVGGGDGEQHRCGVANAIARRTEVVPLQCPPRKAPRLQTLSEVTKWYTDRNRFYRFALHNLLRSVKICVPLLLPIMSI